jgi:hypothetical protein
LTALLFALVFGGPRRFPLLARKSLFTAAFLLPLVSGSFRCYDVSLLTRCLPVAGIGG